MLSYRYESLQYSNSVRLLALHPSLHDSDPIRCTIHHARLSGPLFEYEAVSYTWGNTTRTQAIYFHDGARELCVGQNCYSALRHLRRKHEDRLLWIDAICINQNNLQERARQVHIMDDIFSRASNVLVVLGGFKASHDILFEELAAADEVLIRTGRCDREPPSDNIIQLLEDLFRHPWFRRVWILQEVCAKSSVQFVCGSARFSYTTLRNLYCGYGDTVVTGTYWPIALRWIGSPPRDSSSTQLNLWRRLGQSREYLATDPKDRVFALQSLTGPEKSVLDPLINYAQSTEECFSRVAKFLLPVLGLRLLTAVRHPHDRRMPSWIPDWSQNLPLDWSFFTDYPLDAEDCQPEPSFGAPCKQHYAIRSFTGRSHDISLELLVTGCRYAQIVDRSQVFQFVDIDDARRQMRRMYYSLPNLRQLVDAENMSDDPAMSSHLGEAVSEAMTSMDAEELHTHLCRGCWTSCPGDKNLVHSENIHIFSESLQQCRIGIMENGELVIVPGAVRPGDTICILSGAISACALREIPDGRWALISGDCRIIKEDSEFLHGQSFFLCDEYVACNQDKKEKFRLW